MFDFVKKLFSRKVKILVKRTCCDAKIPCKQHKYDAGFDVYATSVKWFKTIQCWEYGTGINLYIPKGYYIEFSARSSIFKTGLVLTNGHGIIDCNYHDEPKAYFHENVPNCALHPYTTGDRIGQFIIHPYTENVEFVEVDELPIDKYDRKGGFGSTGK